MRIGLVSYEYPPQQGLGGVGTYMFRLATALGRAGHDVHVIAGPSTFSPVDQPNVTLHRIPAQFDLQSDNKAFRWLYWRGFAQLMNWMHPAIWHWIKWDLASHHALRELHAAHPLDIVEVPEHAANGWMAGRIHQWPIVMRMHCPWDLFVRVNRFPFNPMHRVLAGLERHTVASVPDALTVPSEAMRREMSRSWRMRRPPQVVPNFMDVPEAPAPLPANFTEPLITCVGRVEPLKGQDVLVRAFSIIARKHPRARLQIVGPDRWPGKVPFVELLPRWAPDPNVRARIDLLGKVPLQQVPEILRGSRLAVIPSRGFESFSYAALEAMACARPIIATAAGALPELVPNERAGLIVPPADPYLLASAMDRLLADREASEDFALTAHTRARQHYDTPRVLPRIMAAYDDAGDYFYQVKAAGTPRTADQWRRAAEAVRRWRIGHDAGASRTLPLIEPRSNVA
jgi:glycosyltransferase involved in cell wall biosynthesis